MKRTAGSLLALALLAACGGADEEAPADALADSAAAVAPAPVAEAPAGAPTDPQIAMIVVTANSGDSATAELAMTKATDPRVKEFARRMIADHGAVNQQAVALAERLGVTPEPSPTSQALQEDVEGTMQRLEGLSGAEFDRAYIDHEVALHQQVLDALDQTLIPSAQNAELKDLLQKGQPIFTGHLEMAKDIQTSLGGS